MKTISDVTIYCWFKEYGTEPHALSELQPIGVLKADLENMYINKKMTMDEIAKAIDVSRTCVYKWIKKYGIETRARWKGGISFEPYCYRFNNEFKEAVRERDDYTCQLCGYEQKLGGQRLSIHHIHYDKTNCYPDVVALCSSCNSKVNNNRDYWEQYFENQILERGLVYWSLSKET